MISYKGSYTTPQQVDYPGELINHVMEEGHSLEAVCPVKSCNQIIPVSELGGHYEECYKKLHKLQTKEYNRRSSSIEFVCDICGKVSKGKDSHQSHLAVHAKKAKLQKKSIEEAPSSFFCDKCGKEFFTKSRLAVHVWHFHSKIIQCELCDYSCPKPGMRRHM